MNRTRIEELWTDPGNWTWGVIYHCPEDPRVIVPRRWRWGGWTLNFGHPKAGLAGVAAFVLAVAPGMLTLYWFNDPTATSVAVLLSIAALIVWSYLESSRTG